jgi:hypothetical protein
MTRRVATVSRLPQQRCLAPCRFDRGTRGHHDRLLRVDRDPEDMLELLELALTWDELDYDASGTIAPAEWAEFLATHRWDDQDRATRVFNLAGDIAMRCHSAQHGAAALGPEAPVSVYSALTGRAAAVVH